MNRRGFLGGLLALAAPAVITTPGLLMPTRPPLFTLDNYSLVKITPRPFDLNVGDIISFSGFEGMNRNGPTGYDRQFVVTALAKAGANELSIYPPMLPGIVIIPSTRRPPAPAMIFQ